MRDQFPSRSYSETKTELMWRLDTLYTNPVIRKIFSSTETKFNMAEAIAGNKVVLIDASLDILGDDASFFGRFFIALIRLAMYGRLSGASNNVYVYIDEVQLFLDEAAQKLFSMAREARIGVTVATQELSSLSESQLRSSILTNTATKFVGSCPEDAAALAKHVRVDKEVLEQLPQYLFYLGQRGRGPLLLKTNPDVLVAFKQRTNSEVDFLKKRQAASARPQLKLAAEPDTRYEGDIETFDKTKWYRK